jgi:phosphopantothenoylcysteine decarboxylase/phosphopantothenate--cysteine ligase
MQSLENKKILLVISGGIAAYKSLELIRLIKRAGGTVRCILTKGGSEFVTPLSVASLSGEPAYTELFSLKDETEMGHIRLTREADLVIVAPASADLLAKMAQGRADDLASTTLLASDKSVLIAPAMNPEMWDNAATQENLKTLRERGIYQIGPAAGDMACGETGSGRMSEAEDIFTAIVSFFHDQPLKGLKAIVTSGPTYEAIDPVRFIGNRSSGKQGHAIAQALYEAGADVTLITGPVALPDPAGIKTIHVESATDMLKSAESALPADIFIAAAAVSDWRADETSESKIKKSGKAPKLELVENPDILQTIASGKIRPKLVIGFAAETENLVVNAKTKLAKKKADWILANDVSTGIFGAEENQVTLITANQETPWPRSGKRHIARRLAIEVAKFFNPKEIVEQNIRAAE